MILTLNTLNVLIKLGIAVIPVTICFHLLPFTNFILYLLLGNKIYYNNDKIDLCLALEPRKNIPHLFNKVYNVSSDIINTLRKYK